MCTHLVNHVRSYILPNDEGKHVAFIKKVDTFASIATGNILACYSVFMGYEHTAAAGDEGAVIESALKAFFPLPFLRECEGYKAQFLNFENTIAVFALAFEAPMKQHFYAHLERLSAVMTKVVEYTIVQMAELYFLGDASISAFWREVQKDNCLAEIMRRLHVHELVDFKGSRRAFLGEADLSRHACALVDSLVVALIRERIK